MTDRVHFQPSPDDHIPATLQRVVAYHCATAPCSLKRTPLRRAQPAIAHLIAVFGVNGEHRWFVYMDYSGREGGVVMSCLGTDDKPFASQEAMTLRWLEDVGFDMLPIPLDDDALASLPEMLPLKAPEGPEAGELPDQRAPAHDSLNAALSGLTPADAAQRLRDLATFW